MRSPCSTRLGAVIGVALFLAGARLQADAPAAKPSPPKTTATKTPLPEIPTTKPPRPDRVELRGGQLLMYQDGKSSTLPGDITLPEGVIVKTNATFTVNGGKPRPLKEGQSLSRDGTLMSSDGGSTPVMDHVTMKAGKAVLVKDGESQALAAGLVLGNGTQVSPDGAVVFPGGAKTRLLDGQLLKLAGGTLPVQDTITLRNGKVMVQKDGSSLAVGQNQSLMMSDGTKVLGDGTVIEKTGKKIKLKEGQILVVEGVTRRSK